MSRNEVILAVVAGTLVVFSLVVSLVVPRWRPDFPGRRLGLFALVAILLVAAMLGAVEVFGAEEEHGAEATETGTETGGGPPPTTGGTPTGEDTPGDSDQIKRGEELFASEGCGGCHTMEQAGTSGTAGPNLDELQPSLDAVVSQVTNGGGGMPAYGGTLSEADIEAVAAYVVDSTSR